MWLLRQSSAISSQQNLIPILGPFDEATLKAKILAHQFSAEDEVCLANQHWFFLYEVNEVSRFLGNEFVLTKAPFQDAGEVTAPNIEVTQPSVELPRVRLLHPPVAEVNATIEVGSNQVPDDLDDSNNKPQLPKHLYFEKRQLWFVLFVGLVAAAVVGLLGLFRSLQN